LTVKLNPFSKGGRMKCNKCNQEVNEVRWHEILSNGKHVSIGGRACDNKLNIAKAMKYTSYMRGAWNDKIISYREYNHCFNCGMANNEIVTII